jgi:hypothetical protein
VGEVDGLLEQPVEVDEQHGAPRSVLA